MRAPPNVRGLDFQEPAIRTKPTARVMPSVLHQPLRGAGLGRSKAEVGAVVFRVIVVLTNEAFGPTFTDAGEKVQVLSAGNPEQLKATNPL